MNNAVRVPTVIVIINPVLITVGSSGARAIHLFLVHPQIGHQIRVLPIHPCVYYAHPHLQACNSASHLGLCITRRPALFVCSISFTRHMPYRFVL